MTIEWGLWRIIWEGEGFYHNKEYLSVFIVMSSLL